MIEILSSTYKDENDNEQECVLVRHNSVEEKIPLSQIMATKNFMVETVNNQEPKQIIKIITMKECNVCAYTSKLGVLYLTKHVNNIYKVNVKLKKRVLYSKLNKSKLEIGFVSCILNKKDLPVDKVLFQIGDIFEKEIKIEQVKERNWSSYLKNTKFFKIAMDIPEIADKEIAVNNQVKFRVCMENGEAFEVPLYKKMKKIKNKRKYYVPMKHVLIGNYFLYLRRTSAGKIVFVKRPVEESEKTTRYKVLESKFISNILYYAGKCAKKIGIKNVNIYYEKFAQKAEEGTFELCTFSQKSKKSKNYYIIDKTSNDYEKIKDEKYVVEKYSVKYYWLIYRANNIISTESPMHVNVPRSVNQKLKKAIYAKKNIFLQHGIIYMKNLGRRSPYGKNRDAEPTWILVSSKKEQEVVEDMLKLKPEQIWNTGIPMYDKIRCDGINQLSDDIITIMLTWKPYEEHFEDFSKSSYYVNTVKIYEQLLKYVPKEKIRIVPHPKVQNLLESTDLKESMWEKSISEVLTESKLLITDYSSVCYNTFYQGGAVIFYQEDVEIYEQENGKLIPAEDEYIGYRAFSIEELDAILSKNIVNQVINMDGLRTQEFVEMYAKINEFNDGLNISRIYEKLENEKIV